MAQKIELCIFDLDGVIVDTAKYHYIAWQHLAEQFNYKLTIIKNEALKGVSRVQSLDLILQWADVSISEAEKASLLVKKNEEYLDLIQDIVPKDALEGVLSFIEELRKEGIKIALGSASKNARIILDKLKMTSIFDYIVDGTMTTESKPHPQVFLKSCSYFNIAPNKTIVFEDAPKGVEAALNGGMKTVGIGNDDDLSEADVVWSGFQNKGIDSIHI